MFSANHVVHATQVLGFEYKHDLNMNTTVLHVLQDCMGCFVSYCPYMLSSLWVRLRIRADHSAPAMAILNYYDWFPVYKLR